jgi:hypothetical protein
MLHFVLESAIFKMKKFFIYAPSYNPNSGGCIVLHKLCDCLNRLGYEAFIYPMIPSYELNVGNAMSAKVMLTRMMNFVSRPGNFKVNPAFLTPVIAPKFEDFAPDDAVVIYPEVVFGNPLKAKNVVRWLLYTPGETVASVYYGFDELHFLFLDVFGKYKFPRCHTSKHPLFITHWPIETYLQLEDVEERSGVAYCLRKSKRSPSAELLSDGILIDGKAHDEIAKIFKRIKTFISYDPYTAYLPFAVMAGCDSVIAPLPNVDVGALYPELGMLDGIAYGLDDLERARATRLRLIARYENFEVSNLVNTRNFIDEVDMFFP